MNICTLAGSIVLGGLLGSPSAVAPVVPTGSPLATDAAAGELEQREAPPRDLAQESGLPLEAYADALDYDVSYDDSIAATYDDGYEPQAYTQFADSLAPYGTWVDDPIYGRIWVPSTAEVGADFTPYATNGEWVDTEYGWTWASGWAWGWAPFHYGRWVGLANSRWGWVPGTLWGPAWVSWRTGGGYVGWAPLPPRGMSLGSPIGVHSPWRFLATAKLGRARGAYLAPRFVPGLFGATAVVSNARMLSNGRSNVRVNAGPALAFGGRVTLAPVHLATAAPRSLPQVVIQARAGMGVVGRPWVRAGVTQQFPRYGHEQRGAVPASFFGSPVVRGAGVSAPPRAQPNGTRAGASGYVPNFSYRWPSATRSAASPASSPRFTASSPRFTASPPSFTASPPSFTASPSYGRSTFPAARGGSFSHSSGGRHR